MTDKPAFAGRGEGPGTILVVEDDRPTRQLLASILSDAGFSFHVAATGHQAMEYAAASPPAMVVLDMHLPNLQGEAVATALHVQYGRALPILAMSASNEQAAALASGAFDFLPKPFEIDDFLARVRHGLALSADAAGLRQRTGQARQRLADVAARQRAAFDKSRGGSGKPTNKSA
jgi:DNA-binding response OmpR family regulator